MKKLLTGACIALFAISTTFATAKDKGNSEPSYFTQTSFYENFDNTTVREWQSTPAFDKAIFMQDGKEYTAYFTKEGEFVGTTHDINFNELPQAAQLTIEKKYGESSVMNVFNFDDNENSEANFMIENNIAENSDNYFVVLKKDTGKLILQVSLDGVVTYFKEIK